MGSVKRQRSRDILDVYQSLADIVNIIWRYIVDTNILWIYLVDMSAFKEILHTHLTYI